jgi:hypothetical protein
MTDIRKVVKVFLASPGDLQEERRIAKEVIDEFNNLLSETFGYLVELVKWEDAMPSYGRPQAIINRDLDRCEFFIGMIWKRWGTPPATSGPYTSGFEEEFERSIIRHKQSGKPEISLFFKDVDEDQLRDPGDELKKVLAFKNRIISEKPVLFDTFCELQSFEKKIRSCITRHIQVLREKESSGPEKLQSLRIEEPQRQTADSVEPRQDAIFPPATVSFLRQFITKVECQVEVEPIQSVEIARFRLIANALSVQGNDEKPLGVHDANLLFTYRSRFEMGKLEKNSLIATSLENFSSENVPLWFWITSKDGFNRKFLSFHSVIGSSATRVGALSAMKLISDPLFLEGPIVRESYLKSWFSTDNPSEIKIAAVAYLGDCGNASDLPTLQSEFDAHDYKTESAAIDGIIRINLRDSQNAAIRALYDLQPNSIAPSLVEAIFGKNESISNEILLEGLGHKNANIRRKVARLLRERDALDIATSEQLLSDEDPIVRFEGLQALVGKGKRFSKEAAKKILVKPSSKSFLNPFRARNDTVGERCLDNFWEQQLRAMPHRELEEEARTELFLFQNAKFILMERQFAEYCVQLRAAIDDHYEREFNQGLADLELKLGSNSDSIEKIRSIKESIKKEYTRKALDIICRKTDPQDLNRVRQLLNSGFVIYSDADTNYLSQIGEWTDIPLIISSMERQNKDHLLSPDNNEVYQVVAQAIYKLGRTRFDELLKMNAPAPLLCRIIAASSDVVFRQLSEASIKFLLFSEHDQVRKAAVLKCVRAFPKKRLVKLLEDYVAGESSHYYNVIHWLDFGISLPKDRAIHAAEKVISREWRDIK